MIVESLVQRLPRAESVSVAVTSADEAEEVVAWSLNGRLTYQGEPEPGIFLWHYYEPACSWYWEVRSDSGAHMVRFEGADRPTEPAEVCWPENFAQQWEPWSSSTFAA